MAKVLAPALVIAILLIHSGCEDLASEGSPIPPGTTWNLPTTEDQWTSVYNYDDGTFTLSFDASSGILMAPPTPASPSESRAMLLLAKRTTDQPIQDFTLTIQAATEQQLRPSSPNPWEVFWIFFNYKLGTNGLKETNYFLLKPNGIELGRAFNDADQAYLDTADTPTLSVGTANTFKIVKTAQQLEILVDGISVMTFNGDSNDTSGCGGTGCRLYDVAGEIGLYTEDAQVRISSVTVELP